jgi:hypothetical protein
MLAADEVYDTAELEDIEEGDEGWWDPNVCRNCGADEGTPHWVDCPNRVQR